MKDEELKELVASLSVSQKDTDSHIKELQVSLKAIYDQMKLTDVKLDRMGIILGNVGKNQGDVAEDFFYQDEDKISITENFFYQSLIRDNRLGGILFDDIARNAEKHRGEIQEEYDLFMTNDDSIAIVEVKYKAHLKDIDKLDRKINNFKKLFPIYKGYKLYGALAAFHINDSAKKEILDRGYFSLQRSGDMVCSESSDHLKVH